MEPWFTDARFGMFVHWTHIASQEKELSWSMASGVPAFTGTGDGAVLGVEQYYSSRATFRPEPGAAKAWAAAARGAGMRYAVLTAKHHDGFALWPTAFGDNNVAAFGYDGDLVREFVAACRAEDLRVGLYYSLSDWGHPDYPAYADEPYFAYLGKRSANWPDYLAYMRGQLTELLTEYGRIDLLWFDGQWERSAAEWQAESLLDELRALSPGIVINDRLPGGDYATPEQGLPESPDVTGPWETCLTMNRTWGFNTADTAYKPVRDLVHLLCEAAGRGGNVLLNASPDAAGFLPDEQVSRLSTIGSWMSAHGESIVGTSPGLEPWQWYGPSTRRDDVLYLHLLLRPYETVTVRGLPVKTVESVRALGTGSSLRFRSRSTVAQEIAGDACIGDLIVTVPEADVDDLATVLEITFR